MNFETGRTDHICRRKKRRKKEEKKTREGKADTSCKKAVAGLCLQTAGNMALTNEMSCWFPENISSIMRLHFILIIVGQQTKSSTFHSTLSRGDVNQNPLARKRKQNKEHMTALS